MSSSSGGGQFYRDKFKPPTITYMEEHFAEFFNFMKEMSPQYAEYVKNMTTSYVTYMTQMTSKAATYLEQTVPVQMNNERTIPIGPGDATFITPAVGAAVGLIDADFANIEKVFLLIIGRAVNTFNGQNNLDCTVAAHNHWMISVGPAVIYTDLQNGTKADGQMLDTDWECMVLGAIHPFTFMFDITDKLTALNDTIGLRLASANARQNSLIVTIDVYMKIVFKL